MSQGEARQYLQALLAGIAWQHDEVVVQGQKVVTKRKVAFYGDSLFEYTYSKSTKRALPWISELLPLKLLVEQYTGEVFNACLLNYYHNGSEGMAWHGTVMLRSSSSLKV
jgi:alkylated DNA repair dioxygenase AlkB